MQSSSDIHSGRPSGPHQVALELRRERPFFASPRVAGFLVRRIAEKVVQDADTGGILSRLGSGHGSLVDARVERLDDVRAVPVSGVGGHQGKIPGKRKIRHRRGARRKAGTGERLVSTFICR